MPPSSCSPGASQNYDIATNNFESDSESEADLADLYRSETPWLVRYFRRNSASPEEAADLAQETFLRFVRAAPINALVAPQGYIRRIAINLAKNWSERSSTRIDRMKRPLNEGLDVPTSADQHRELAAREELEFCKQTLSELEPRTLEIFLLNRIDGYGFREIGARYGMSEWAVRRVVLKALAHLMAAMESR